MPNLTDQEWTFHQAWEYDYDGNDNVTPTKPPKGKALGWISCGNESVVEYHECGSHTAEWNMEILPAIMQIPALLRAVNFLYENRGRDPEADDEMIAGMKDVERTLAAIKNGKINAILKG